MPFLPLLAIRVCLIDHINTTSTANDFVAFGWVGFDGSSYSHKPFPYIYEAHIYKV
jgi:hypothetical protein